MQLKNEYARAIEQCSTFQETNGGRLINQISIETGEADAAMSDEAATPEIHARRHLYLYDFRLQLVLGLAPFVRDVDCGWLARGLDPHTCHSVQIRGRSATIRTFIPGRFLGHSPATIT